MGNVEGGEYLVILPLPPMGLLRDTETKTSNGT